MEVENREPSHTNFYRNNRFLIDLNILPRQCYLATNNKNMHNYTLNIATGKITKTRNTKGLLLNKKGAVYGLTVESDNLIDATDKLNEAHTKWEKWITAYNYWVYDPNRTDTEMYKLPDNLRY